MHLIKNARIITCTGRDYENGYIITEGTKIRDIGDMASLPPAPGAVVHNAAGKTLCPGFVDAHSHAGIGEEIIRFDGDDVNETTDAVCPHLRAIDAINPADRSFSDALRAGITTLVIGPGSANPIGGTFCALKTMGDCVDDMCIKNDVAMKFALGENPKRTGREEKRAPLTRMATAALLREALFSARDYAARREAGENLPYNMRMEALLPVVRGEMLVKCHAHRADDICTILRIAAEFGLRLSIEHCTEGWRIAPRIAAAGVPVTVGPLVSDRSKPELANASMENAAILERHGVSVSIIADHGETPEELLPLYAGLAARAGMPQDAALRAITINAAQNCGIADRVGSLEVGKDADIAVFSGFPLAFDSQIVSRIVNGTVVQRV